MTEKLKLSKIKLVCQRKEIFVFGLLEVHKKTYEIDFLFFKKYEQITDLTFREWVGPKIGASLTYKLQ